MHWLPKWAKDYFIDGRNTQYWEFPMGGMKQGLIIFYLMIYQDNCIRFVSNYGYDPCSVHL